MKILKFIFILLIIIFVSAGIIYFIFTNNYNLEKIISNLKKNYDVTILINKDPKWSYKPELSFNFNAKINNSNKDLNSEKMEFIFSQPYKISPINVNVGSKSLNFRGLKIQSFNLIGKYYFLNKIFNINNLTAKIGDGEVNFQAKLNQSNKNEFSLIGGFSNLHLNQILRQLNLADWKRLELKISSNDLIIDGKIIGGNNFVKYLNGKIPINGSMYFVTTEEERFSVAFLNLLVEKLLPDYKNLSKSLSQIINNYSDKPVLFKGTLEINNGVVHTTNLSAINNNNKINVNGTYDIINNYFDTKLFFIESEKIIVEAKIEGNLENPKIKIVNENTTFNNEKIKNDLNKVFGDGVNTLIDKLLNLND